MNRIAVFPGSFDPITVGHEDLIRRAAACFDRLHVAVLINPAKPGWISREQRVALIRKVCADLPNVQVDLWTGLLADYVQALGGAVVVRGLRDAADYLSEARMAELNRRLNPKLETVFLLTRPEVAFVSSSAVREIAVFGGDVDPLIPPAIRSDIQSIISQQ